MIHRWWQRGGSQRPSTWFRQSFAFTISHYFKTRMNNGFDWSSDSAGQSEKRHPLKSAPWVVVLQLVSPQRKYCRLQFRVWIIVWRDIKLHYFKELHESGSKKGISTSLQTTTTILLNECKGHVNNIHVYIKAFEFKNSWINGTQLLLSSQTNWLLSYFQCTFLPSCKFNMKRRGLIS